MAALPTGSGPPAIESEPSSGTFWKGVGPANFALPYLRHKLPEASEEIQDPHNMVLEVWAEAGVFAMLALLLALAIGLREILGPSKEGNDQELEPVAKLAPHPRSGSTWLIGMAGLGWLAVWALGRLNPVTNGDLLMRWLILGVAWVLAVLLGAPLWRRRPIPAAGLGVGVLAVSVNLLASGGIGIPSVAMSLWVLLALGPEPSRGPPLRSPPHGGGLGPTVVLACVWAGLAGTFYGAVMPFWESESLRVLADSALEARPPAYEAAREAYQRAIEADHYNVKPWLGLADLEYAYWKSPEKAKRKEPQFMYPLLAIDGALDAKWRNPFNLGLRRRQASYARTILREMPADAKPNELLPMLTTIVKATRVASGIYPTSATLRAELATASAEIGMYGDAVREAKQALALDGLTPHLDKKLTKPTRAYLEGQIKVWETKAKEPPPTAESLKNQSRSPGGGRN